VSSFFSSFFRVKENFFAQAPPAQAVEYQALACQAKSFLKKSLLFVLRFDSLGDMKNNKKKIRIRVEWNTGTRIELPVKGKGAYSRKNKHKKGFDTDEEN